MPRSMGSDNQRIRNDDNEEIMGFEIHESASVNGDGELTSVENSVEGLAGLSDQEMEIRGELGFQNELNPQVNVNVQNNEDVPITPHNSDHSPLHSPQSVVDSVSSSNIPVEINRASDLLMAVSVSAEANKTKITKAAVSAMEELIRKAFEGAPLWQHQGDDNETEILNEAEYIREFRAFDATLKEIMRMVEVGEPQCMANLDGNNGSTSGTQQNPDFRRETQPDVLQTEASRETVFVHMNPTSLVECLMDLEQWSSAFSSIVSRANLLGVLSTRGAGNYDETLQVMKAEFHMPTPLVPVRECQFARYCKELGSGTWGVVDVSLENVFPYPLLRFRRRPSGCLIQEMLNGHSKVTWVEHVEVDNTFGHGIFQPLLISGFAFSAKRWVATLTRHCDWIATLMSGNCPNIDGVLIPQIGKESLLRLAGRMMRNFCLDITASTNNLWMPFPAYGAEDFRVMTKSISIIPLSHTTTLVFTNTLWLSAPPKRVFDFLRHEDSRNKWDLLAHGQVIREVAHIIKGESPENRVSVMQVESAPNRIEILHLQESYYDPTGSYVVYAPMDIPAMCTVFNGANPDNVIILPSGFVIHPDRPLTKREKAGGSLLTLAFHIMDHASTENCVPSESINAIQRILTETASLIKEALSCDNP